LQQRLQALLRLLAGVLDHLVVDHLVVEAHQEMKVQIMIANQGGQGGNNV
jgi:hypothetical protein